MGSTQTVDELLITTAIARPLSDIRSGFRVNSTKKII